MKVILVNPPASTIVEAHDRPDYPHAGLGYLSAYLNTNGITCDIIDAKLERLSPDKVLTRLTNAGPSLVGISAMTHDIMNAARLADAIKRANSQTTVIIGGVHASALPKETLANFSSFDFLVHGEGEVTLYELVKTIENTKPFDQIKGIAYRDGNHIVVNPPRLKIENLDELPFPDISKFPRCKEYHISTSRGCPFRCIFCMSPYGRDKIRERSPQNVIEELREIEKQKPQLIKLNDETFGYNRPRAMELLDMIIATDLHHTKKVASLRADHVDLALLKKMKAAGFHYIDYGIESGNPEILKKIKKGITLEQSERAIRMTKEAGIRVGANFIIGHPGETKKTALETIDFAVKLNADVNAIGLMVPYPGTEVAEMAQKGEGGYRLLSYNWEDYNKQLGNALELVTLTRQQMEKFQLAGYLKILIFNFRFLDLFLFGWQNRRSGIAFLKKAMKGSQNQ
jgi:anaerobic magnesium-protoporphyrin IX monomethyl ester cyclase